MLNKLMPNLTASAATSPIAQSWLSYISRRYLPDIELYHNQLTCIDRIISSDKEGLLQISQISADTVIEEYRIVIRGQIIEFAYGFDDHTYRGFGLTYMMLGSGEYALVGISVCGVQLTVKPEYLEDITLIFTDIDSTLQCLLAEPYLPATPTVAGAWGDYQLIYPLTEPMYFLRGEKETAVEYAVMCRIKSMIEERNSDAAGYLFSSGNSTADYVGKRFAIKAHNYNDNEDVWNFVWRDVSVEWYKHFNRDLRISRRMALDEMADMLTEVGAEIESDFPKGSPKPTMTPSPEQRARNQYRLTNNSTYGAFNSPKPQVSTSEVRPSDNGIWEVNNAGFLETPVSLKIKSVLRRDNTSKRSLLRQYYIYRDIEATIRGFWLEERYKTLLGK